MSTNQTNQTSPSQPGAFAGICNFAQVGGSRAAEIMKAGCVERNLSGVVSGAALLALTAAAAAYGTAQAAYGTARAYWAGTAGPNTGTNDPLIFDDEHCVNATP